jgi:hypothetical protein
MVNEENVGVLAYEQVKADSMCAGPKPTASRTGLFGVFASLARLFRQGTAVVQPTPLLASTMVALPKSGATVTGAKSKFKLQDVPPGGVSVVFSVPPPPLNIKVNTGRFTATAEVSASGAPIAGTSIALSGVNNNGTPTQILQVTDGTSGCVLNPPHIVVPAPIVTTIVNQHSIVTWENLCVNKTGALKLVGTATVDGRSGTGVGVTSKLNVKP